MALLLRARRRRAADERGFSLLEVIIGITILAGIFMAGGQVLGSSLMGVLYSRQNQQVADVISQEIEGLRAGSYAAVAMVTSDLAGDTSITQSFGHHWFDPDGTGPLAAEKIVTATGGLVNPHVELIPLNGTTFRLTKYVTDPEDALGKYRRVTVRATWTRGGREYTRQSSTFVTLTRRGLPLPNFTFTGPVTVQANRDTTLVLPVSLTNRGATDSWNLSAQNLSGRTWTTLWYKDDGSLDGAWDLADTLLLDTDADGRPETGELGTDEAAQLFAVVQLSPTEAAGTVSHKLTAQSMAQPSSPTATASVTDTVEVLSQSCPGCTYSMYYLHNADVAADSTAVSPMPIYATAPSATTLYNYDTNVDSAAGRKLTKGGLVDTSSGSTIANWRYQQTGAKTYRGTANLRLYVADADPGDLESALALTVFIRYQATGNTYTLASTTSTTVSPGGSFQAVDLAIPVDFTVTNNKRWEVKVVASSAVDHDDAVLAYGTTIYPASIEMPVAS